MASIPSMSMRWLADCRRKLLLILERAHGGQCTELMVEGGDAHARNGGEFFHVQRFGVVGAEPGDGSCGSVAEIAGGGDGAEAFALRRAKDAVDDFALDQVAEKGNVLGGVEKVDEPSAGARANRRWFRRRRCPRDAMEVSGSGRSSRLEDLADGGHIEPEKHGEQRDLFRGFDDLALGGNIDGGQKEGRTVAEVDVAVRG